MTVPIRQQLRAIAREHLAFDDEITIDAADIVSAVQAHFGDEQRSTAELEAWSLALRDELESVSVTIVLSWPDEQHSEADALCLAESPAGVHHCLLRPGHAGRHAVRTDVGMVTWIGDNQTNPKPEPERCSCGCPKVGDGCDCRFCNEPRPVSREEQLATLNTLALDATEKLIRDVSSRPSPLKEFQAQQGADHARIDVGHILAEQPFNPDSSPVVWALHVGTTLGLCLSARRITEADTLDPKRRNPLLGNHLANYCNEYEAAAVPLMLQSLLGVLKPDVEQLHFGAVSIGALVEAITADVERDADLQAVARVLAAEEAVGGVDWSEWALAHQALRARFIDRVTAANTHNHPIGDQS